MECDAVGRIVVHASQFGGYGLWQHCVELGCAVHTLAARANDVGAEGYGVGGKMVFLKPLAVEAEMVAGIVGGESFVPVGLVGRVPFDQITVAPQRIIRSGGLYQIHEIDNIVGHLWH